MADAPLISVILPIFNVRDYLPKCMESLREQSYKNLEIILVDDGSTDGCAALSESLAAKDERSVVYHKENGGLSDARNFGLARANGEYLTFIDPDDYVDYDYVSYLYSLIETYETPMSICQHRVVFTDGGIRDYGNPGSEQLPARTCIERMLYHDVIDTSAWGKLYRRDLFDGVEYPVGRLFEDINTTYRLMLNAGEVAVGYESKYTHVTRLGSIVTSTFSPRKYDLITMTDEMGVELSRIYPELRYAIERRKLYARFSVLNQMMDAEGVEEHRREILGYIRQHGIHVLRDSKTPRRDKIAIMLAYAGYPLYKAAWLKTRRR